MAFKLKLKRGTAAPSNTALDIAEPGYDTSAKKLYIGNGSGVAASAVSMDGHKHSFNDITEGGIVGVANGGTGLSSYAVGDILYASGSSTLSKLGIGSTNQILTVVGGVPAWANAGQAASVANSLVLKVNTGTAEGTSLYTYNGSTGKTLDFVNGAGITLTPTAGTLSIAHSVISSAANLVANGRTYVTGLTFDTFGHVTGYTTGTETVVNTNTTYSISALDGTAGKKIIRLTGSDSTTDDVTLVQGSNVTLTRTGDEITIASAHPTITTTTDTTSSVSPAFGGTFTAVDTITRDSNGHVTTLNTKTITLPTPNYAITAGATDGIFDITGTGGTNSVSYAVAPYAAKTVGGFDSSATTPTGTTRLNWNGYFYATQLFEGAERVATKTYVDSLLGANDAMVYKGTLGTGGTVTVLPTTYSAGWTYRVITVGTYADKACEVGDLITAIVDRAGTGNTNADWTVIQTNLDGAVIGPASATTNNFAAFDGTTGKLIKDSGFNSSSFATSSHTHAITAITAGNYKIFYSNGSGNVVELALGAAGTYLQSNGAASAPTFASIDLVTNFLALTDTPSSYTSAGGKLVAVNSGATALEFINELDCGTYAV